VKVFMYDDEGGASRRVSFAAGEPLVPTEGDPAIVGS
jgi:hypothetical protein